MPKEQNDMENHAEDREYVREQVSKKGALLEFASDTLKNDKEIVLEAIKNNPEALEFASDELKKDREVVFESVSKVRLDLLLCKGKFAKRQRAFNVRAKMYRTNFIFCQSSIKR